jgi:DNA-directed RNA polymerase specialized sigma24 family protein
LAVAMTLDLRPDGAPSDLRQFPTTRWSLVARACGGAGAGGDGPVGVADVQEARRQALAAILLRYLPALRAHLLAKSIPPDRADDLLQAFVTDKVIERNLLARADRARGRFRWFLAAALNNYCANQLRADTAGKRVPAGVKLVSLAEGMGAGAGAGAAAADGPAAGADGAADAFDVAWAREAIAEALRRMRDECVACGRVDLWHVFEWRVLGPTLDDADPVGYAELVRRLGYATPKAAANALVTAKRRFEQALRSVIAEYVGDDEELELELAGLGDVLASAAQLERSDGAASGDDRRGLK